ncbi:MAG TPA: glycoside hydrolase family 57 protein [Patescibacteria group bacterium]|jgi:alpha-amylase|nr:glycoside hydrolase family 57 protein [Patescibacteria group bacterium]
MKSQRAICLYLHVHQPYRVRPYSIFEAGQDHNYFFNPDTNDPTSNEHVLHKVASKSYLPTNKYLIGLLQKYPEFRLSLSITGTVLEQLEMWSPEALKSFQELIATGRVEVIGETYHHSLAFFYSRSEFEEQVRLHAAKIKQLFGVKPTVFRNTELAYNNDLAYWADQAGYKGIISEGWDPILGWRSPNFVYRPAYTKNIRLLMKNYRMSDDIAFRFSDKNWREWPLTASKFVHWVNSLDSAQTNINLFMDYETFGEHQWESTGIFDFLEHLPAEFLSFKNNTFMTISEAIDSFEPVDQIDTPYTVTWADTERDLTAWLGNSIQQQAIAEVYNLEAEVLATKDAQLIEDWRRLQTSDHVYYMCTKWFRDGDVHAYFSPYESPYEAFISFSNALRDLKLRVLQKGGR